MAMIVYGSTTNFVISYDSSLTGGSVANGPVLSQAALDYCEYDLARLSRLFGEILPAASSLPIQVNLVPGGGGGSNNLLNYIAVNCSVNTEPMGVVGVAVAELAEIFMALQNKGWIAYHSNGEALSRVCGGLLYPNRAWLFQTGNDWLNGFAGSPNAARSNWVDNVYPSDQDFVSIGCGTLFLNYLAAQLNYRWTDIIAAGAPTTKTLAETAQILGVANPWTDFSNLITAHFPAGSFLPPQPTQFGQPNEPTDNPFPLGATTIPAPQLYIRHNLADDGTTHTGSLSDSPDIIMKNNPVANPQATFSTAASIASDTESDAGVLTGQTNYVYQRVWNRGADANNVFATVYWSPPATLVTPNLWTLIGSSYFPNVPAGSAVEVSVPGITWPSDQLPPAGHDCFVAAVGNAFAPGPNPANFATFTDFENYIYANNNITWRNFNVVTPMGGHLPHWGKFLPLPFLLTGAWREEIEFAFETDADLPEGSHAAVQVPHWVGIGLKPGHPNAEELEDRDTDDKHHRRLRIAVTADREHKLGRIALPAETAVRSHLLVHVPLERHAKPYRVVIRQLHGQREVGRITWLLLPPKHHGEKRD